jgi:hypothetical protein
LRMPAQPGRRGDRGGPMLSKAETLGGKLSVRRRFISLHAGGAGKRTAL